VHRIIKAVSLQVLTRTTIRKTTYLILLQMKKIYSIICCLILSFQIFSQGSTCATAQALNTNGCTNGNDDGLCSWTSPGSGVVNPACGTGPFPGGNGQGWYTITTSATATSWVFEAKKVTGGGTNPINDPAFQLYSGTCAGLTLISCYNSDAGSGTDEKEVLALAPSTTYYIRVFDADGSMVCSGGGRNYQWSVCFYDFEPGDDCDNAIPVTLSSTCGYSTYNSAGFIRSDEANPTCGSGSTAADMWFQFTTDATGTVAVDLTPGSITDSGMEIYSGACGALTSVGCNDDKGFLPNYPNGLMSRLEGTLTPSTSYYARVWQEGGGTGTFDACFRLRPTPSYDACGSPMPLALGTTYPVTNWGSSISVITDPASPSACNGSLDNSVWFSFTTAAAGDYTVDVFNQLCSQGKGMQVDIGTWTGGSCVSANWSSLSCQNPGDCNDITYNVSGLAAATTYYIFADGWGAMGEDVEFDILVNPVVALPVELIKFTGKPFERFNMISWQTNSEVNNDYFLIEKSIDGDNFTQVAQVMSKGNGDVLTDYAVQDYTQDELVYYRLIQVDFDGKTKYSQPISVFRADSYSDADLLKIVNMVGQEVTEEYEGLKIYCFSDGTSLKMW
jgi:hypothetical protein